MAILLLSKNTDNPNDIQMIAIAGAIGTVSEGILSGGCGG